MELDVDADFGPLLRDLGFMASRQVPFAVAVALTEVGKDSRQAVAASLRQHFQIRSPWIERGIRYTPASKRDWPNTHTTIGSRDWFMADQETGGVRRPRGGHRLPIPGGDLRSQPSERITRARWPSRLLRKRAYFINRLTSGPRAGREAVLQRDTAERYPLRVLHVFAGKVNVRPRLHMRETVTGVVAATYQMHFTRALARSLKPRESVK
jgi:hypothetical protein